MAVSTFDKKFGEQFLATVPKGPGVYRFYGKTDDVLYVGKAKDLRNRLGQYRAAKRIKAHRKMNRIVRASTRVDHKRDGGAAPRESADPRTSASV